MGVSVGPPGFFVTDCKEMQNTKKERLSQGRIPKKIKEIPGQNTKKERKFQGRILKKKGSSRAGSSPSCTVGGL